MRRLDIVRFAFFLPLDLAQGIFSQRGSECKRAMMSKAEKQMQFSVANRFGEFRTVDLA